MRRPVLALAAFFIAAVWISLLLDPPLYSVNKKADGRYVTISGVVERKEYAVSERDNTPYMKLTLKYAAIETELPAEAVPEISKDDKILCRISDDVEKQEMLAAEGSKVLVKGKIRIFKSPANEGSFDEALYFGIIHGYLFALEQTQILAYTTGRDIVRSSLFSIRKYLSGCLDAVFTDMHGEEGKRCASVLKGMFLGETGLIDDAFREHFQAAGIIHVLCISGLHISMAGMAVYTVLTRIGAPASLSSCVSFFLLFLYGVMTGLSASCFRAVVMFAFRMAAKALGRTSDPATSMSVAAILLLIEQPCYLLHSGFLFSFTAVAAVCLAAPCFSKYSKPFVIPLFTLPVQLSFYYAFPLYSVPLNLLVILFAPLAMMGCCLCTAIYVTADIIVYNIPFLSDLMMCAAHSAAEIPFYILHLFEWLCSVTEKFPFHSIAAGKPDSAVIVIYYLLLIGAASAGVKKDKLGRKKDLIQAAAVLAAVFMLFRFRYNPPFAFYMLDVGQGDSLCVLTQDEGGECCIMIDGGSSSLQNPGQYVEIPFLKYHGITRIDHCIVTHDDMDHCSGILEILAQSDEPGGIQIGNLELPSVSETCRGNTYGKLVSTAKEKGIPVTYLSRGMKTGNGELSIECLHPMEEADYESANEYSAVLLMKYGQFSVLLTGDLEGEGEKDFLAYLGDFHLETNVLKAAHHGSAGGTSPEFLDKVTSHTALISCGKNNNYGHPAPETVRRLTDAGMRIFDTRKDGQISIMTDGQGKYSVYTFIDKSK